MTKNNNRNRILIICTTDSMIWNFLIPHILHLQSIGYVVECACSVTGTFFSDLKNKYKLRLYQVCFERSPYSLKNIKALYQLYRIVKQGCFDTVFCHEPVGGAIGRMVGHLCHCKVIYMAHGFHFYKGAAKSTIIYYLIEKFLSRYTDALITINREDFEVSKKFQAKQNYLLNGIGVDTKKFKFKPDNSYLRRELGLSNDDLILISVGELIARKNHETVIRAMNKLEIQNIHYVVVGSGILEGHLKALIADLKLSNVHLLGYRVDINELCNSADIFILPSYQEGLSVALMEAMACGLPVIASNIRGNVDLIDKNEGGFLVEATEIDEYANCILELVKSPDTRVRMGKHNMIKIMNYDVNNIILQLSKIIDNIYTN